MKNKILSIFAITAILMSSPSQAATINFDDGAFPNPVGGQMEYIYGGFKWYNLEEAYDDTGADWPSNHEAYTKPYALKTVNDSLKQVYITPEDPAEVFTFNGFSIRNISAKDLNVTINGYLDGALQYSYASPLTKDYIYLANAGYENVNIDKLLIDWAADQSGVNIDDFGYNTPVPEPTSLILGSLAGIAGLVRRFFKAA